MTHRPRRGVHKTQLFKLKNRKISIYKIKSQMSAFQKQAYKVMK